MRHGEGHDAHAPADDPALSNIHADMGAYLILERALCTCEALCECGWDEDPWEEDR